jgi:3-dehydroquinate dehydratase-1
VLDILPKICVSIAAEKLDQLQNQILLAQKFGADFLEIRFDYLSISDIEGGLQYADAVKSRAVYTLRDKSEFGRFQGTDEERVYWLTRLVDAKPMLVDIEFSTLKTNQNIKNYVRKNNTSILVSWHNHNRTPRLEDLKSLMSEMKKFSSHIKIVTMAKSIEDSISILELYREIGDSNLVAFAMGEKGIISRILCGLCKPSPFTYASLGSEVAPGQLSITQMKKLYDGVIRNNGVRAID